MPLKYTHDFLSVLTLSKGGTPGYATYGATKRGLPQLTASLVKELDDGVQGYQKVQTKGKIQIHNLSPGMVFTQVRINEINF